MAKLISTEIVGVANRPATICDKSTCVWFDTTNEIPNLSYLVSVWATGSSISTARAGSAGAGTQNLALTFGGVGNAGNLSSAEEYNGTSWLAGGNLIAARRDLSGSGIQNCALAIGGPGLNSVEAYNGSTWASRNGLISTARSISAAFGVETATLVVGGYNSNTLAFLTSVELYNGTTWTSVNSITTARGNHAGMGSTNAGLITGGYGNAGGTAPLSTSQEYDGSTWQSGGSLITARHSLNGAGTQNEGLVAAGRSGGTFYVCTEEYNGLSWSTSSASFPQALQLCGSMSGLQSAAIAPGGLSSGSSQYITNTYFYNKNILDIYL